MTPTVLLDGKFSMTSVTIDVTIFDLSAYYNPKMDCLEFLGNGNFPIYCGRPMTMKFQIDGDKTTIRKLRKLPICFGHLYGTT